MILILYLLVPVSQPVKVLMNNNSTMFAFVKSQDLTKVGRRAHDTA